MLVQIYNFDCSYFVDVRLYKRAKSIADPFAFEQYKKKKIREKIELERPSRMKIEDNLPKVNRDLASKLMDVGGKKKKKQSGDLLKDDRFKVLLPASIRFMTEMYEIHDPHIRDLLSRKWPFVKIKNRFSYLNLVCRPCSKMQTSKSTNKLRSTVFLIQFYPGLTIRRVKKAGKPSLFLWRSVCTRFSIFILFN